MSVSTLAKREMQLNAFIIRIAFLALPGILGSAIYRKLRGRTTKRVWENLIEILLFSVVSYALYGAALEFYSYLSLRGSESGTDAGKLHALQALFDSKPPVVWYEILVASSVGVALGFAASYAHKFKLLIRMALRMRATDRAGDEDVWDYVFNDPRTEWVLVRDHKLNLMYFGYVRSYSDSEKERELLLENVDVYQNATGEKLYATEVLYLSRQRHDLSVERISEASSEEDSFEDKSTCSAGPDDIIEKDNLGQSEGNENDKAISKESDGQAEEGLREHG